MNISLIRKSKTMHCINSKNIPNSIIIFNTKQSISQSYTQVNMFLWLQFTIRNMIPQHFVQTSAAFNEEFVAGCA